MAVEHATTFAASLLSHTTAKLSR